MKRLHPATLKALSSGRLPPGIPADDYPRLRFDRVAQRLVRSLQETLAEVAPKKAALVITVTAPIRSPAGTVEELRARLDGSRLRNFDEAVCGNRVRARIVRGSDRAVPRVIVFVHNPEPDPARLFKLVGASLRPAPRTAASTPGAP